MKPIMALALALAATPIAAAEPVLPFAEQPQPPAPDYANPASWAAGSASPGASAAVPKGASPANRNPKVDVFYIHPTTYLSADHWNQDVADHPANAWVDASVVARQASVFNACCRVFAPRYRQGSRLALSQMAGQGRKALDLAYSDVERAFDYYVAHENHGRPFILAGHSQGGLHLSELLRRRIDGTPLQRRLVAAYVIGYNLSDGDFSRTYKSLTVCAKPTQTGCVVGWNAVLPAVDLAKAAPASEKRFVDLFGDLPDKTTLCVNPLTFDRDKPEADRNASKGAVPGYPGEGTPRPLVPHAVAAKCVHGFLVVEPAGKLGLEPLPGGSMHYHDYGLFYADLRANALARTEAFGASH